MLSPLGVADSLLDTAERRLEQRQATRASDLATIELVEQNMASFRKDMDRDVAFERLQIEKALDGMVSLKSGIILQKTVLQTLLSFN